LEKYHHLSYEERVKIAQLWQSKASITQIAKASGRSKSTISRELRRNQAPPGGAYWPDRAQRLTKKRRQRQCLLDKNEDLKRFVITKLCCHYWTPEQIAGHLKCQQKELPAVSHETLYAWIYRQPQKQEKLWKFLSRHKATRGLRKSKGAGASRIPKRISIHSRPKCVDTKRVFGHWEGDLMSFQRNSQSILVLRERKTMFTQSVRLPSKRAVSTAQNILNILKELPKKARKTLTLDNGGEFAHHTILQQEIGLKTFFCDPYASWQKGGVENTNGRLRRDLPRKTDVKKMKQEDFDEVIENYNTTPRKSLGWLTPLQAFNQNLRRVALRA
jgi:transposase, IS30 family